MKKQTTAYLLALVSLLILSGCTTPTSTDGIESLGDASAPVKIEEFSDLQCPACAAISPLVEAIVKKNPKLVKLEYRHFPLGQHAFAFRAAEASECAGDQGKFWEFITMAFQNQQNLSDDRLYVLAKDLGLNEEPFRTCFNDREKKSRIQMDQAEGERRGVDATPTFFVNGEKVRFSDAETFEAYIKSLSR